MQLANLSDRIENVLNEARMLLLGGQVLLGFSFRICFEDGFRTLPHSARLSEVIGLGVMTLGLGWLIWPAAFHQITERGSDTERMNRFTTGILDWGLLPFGIGLGFSFYPVACALHLPYPTWIGALAGVIALIVWYGCILFRRKNKAPKMDIETPNLSNRIKKVLMECRMALPGAQAFLGFQFAIVFTQGFTEAPRSSQLVHFVSLVATTISIVLLIAPAAYHRLAEHGEDTEHFHKVASRLLLMGLVFLAPGMAGDLMVVMRQFIAPAALSIWISVLLLCGFYALWFGVSFWKRKQS